MLWVARNFWGDTLAAEQNVDLIVQEEFFPPKSFAFLRDRRRKVIIEVGAAKPDYLSISASFRTLGWKVVAIEPNPVFCEAHRKLGHEVLQYACSDDERDDVDFFVVNSLDTEYMGGTVSDESFSSLGIHGDFAKLHDTVKDRTNVTTIKVKVRKLDTILARHEPSLKRIDVLAVDVEGWELNVMRGFSLDRYRPKVVILENNFDTPDYLPYMSARGYRHWRHLAPNDIFVADG